MRHLDLFSGIGGFALAVDRVWPNSTHIFCDNDLFCQEVLRKHWPNSMIYGDIRTITDTEYDGRFEDGQGDRPELLEGIGQEKKVTGNKQAQTSDNRFIGSGRGIDLLTGGFPCQPFSAAGRRRGTDDDRYLWPEMLRVIQLTKPTWIIAENVGGFVTWNEGLVLEQVCLDLENENYEVQPFIIPAVSVNAPHRRDRVWIVSHTKDTKRQRWGGGNNGDTTREERTLQTKGHSSTLHKNINNTQYEGLERYPETNKEQKRWESEVRSNAETGWDSNWIEVATRLCRVDDGIPTRMDRTSRLKALGNAIVSQVAEEIMKAIKYTSEDKYGM